MTPSSTTTAADRLRRSALALLAGSLALSTAACGSTPEKPEQLRLAERYFEDNNLAARHGPQAQEDFFRRTQHPDFQDQTCQLGTATVDLQPAMSTLRPDPDYSPSGVGPPRGDVWVIGVEVTTRRDGAVIGRQIGSQHLVLLDGRIHGFAPCPS